MGSPKIEQELTWGSELLSRIRKIPVNCSAAVLMRHSERDPIGDIKYADGVLLTRKGEEDAYRFGQLLPVDFILKVYYSHVNRCQVTAERILEGFAAAGGKGNIVGSLEQLYAPYVLHFDEVIRIANELGAGFLRAWFSGQLSKEYIKALDEASREQLLAVVETLKELPSGHLSLLVSHDWNIMSILESFLGTRYEEDGWLEYMDGPVVYLEKDIVRISWRHYMGNIPLAWLEKP